MKQITQLLREIIPVILGILIALVINNWNEDRKERKYLNQIFTSINSELEESIADIKDSLPKQQILVDTISKYLKDESITIFELIEKGGGISGPMIKNNSWKAIANSRIELVKFEKLSQLSEIDQSKEFLQIKTVKLLDFVIDNIKSTDQEKKEVFLLLNREIINSEKYVLSEMEAFVEK